MLNTDQILASQRAHLDALVAMGGTTLDGVEQLVRLNLSTVKAVMDESSSAAMAALSSGDAQRALELQAGWVQPAVTHAATYQEQATEIVRSTGTALAKQIEAAMAVVQRDLAEAFKPLSD